MSIIFSITFLSMPSLGGFIIETEGLPFCLIKSSVKTSFMFPAKYFVFERLFNFEFSFA